MITAAGKLRACAVLQVHTVQMAGSRRPSTKAAG
jgi:hypothetical protein